MRSRRCSSNATHFGVSYLFSCWPRSARGNCAGIDTRSRTWSAWRDRRDRTCSGAGARPSPHLPASPPRYPVARGSPCGRRRARARPEGRGRAAVRGQCGALLSAGYAAAESAIAADDADAADAHVRILVIGDQWNARGRSCETARAVSTFARRLSRRAGIWPRRAGAR